MKARSKRFLAEENIDHTSEIFNYIEELHDYLWRFVRVVMPSASGVLDDFVDDALVRLVSQINVASTAEKSKEASGVVARLGAGNGYPHRYWECECCGSLIVTLEQDDAGEYKCPQCGRVNCKHGGHYNEIELHEFCAKANIACG